MLFLYDISGVDSTSTCISNNLNEFVEGFGTFAWVGGRDGNGGKSCCEAFGQDFEVT